MEARNRGFTIIELMLAMAFLSMLLMAIAVATIHIAKLYDRGMAMRTVNQSGRDLVASIKRDARSFGSLTEYMVDPASDTNSLGRLCLGTVSYLWNDPDRLRAGNGVRYKTSGGAMLDQIVMARVSDVGGSYCRKNALGNYNSNVFNDQATELLKSSDHDLAVHDFKFDDNFLSAAGRNQLYRITFTLGTNQEGTIDSSLSCKPPGDIDSNFNFCAVNNFELMVSVG